MRNVDAATKPGNDDQRGRTTIATVARAITPMAK
jgi:hypothetical protein